MAKLTKQETRQHNQIMDLVHSDKALTYEEKLFIIENFHEGAFTNNSELGAFFTPIGLARDFTIDACTGGSVIDLCAGIGGLSFAMVHYMMYNTPREIVCVELNHTYYELGKRIVPEASWVHGEALTTEFNQVFDMAISNPPFGKIKTSDFKGKYTGAEFEYKVIERASQIARQGTFIIPQMSANFRYSKTHCFRQDDSTTSSKCKKFLDETGLVMNPGCGIDTGYYLEDWKGVKPLCEVVCMEFEPETKSDLFTFTIE